MATINKNFKIKNGLIVEGTTATVNNENILTEGTGDSYILNLVGGATLVKSVDPIFNVDTAGNLTLNYSRDNVPNTVMYRDGFGNLAANQLDLDDKLTARDVRFGNAGQIKDNNGPLLVRAYSQNNLQLEADLNVNITANQAHGGGSISLTGDQVTLWTNNGAYINEDEIVTRSAGQTLSNKRISNQLTFGEANTNDAWIQGQFDGAGDLTIHAGNTLYLDAPSSDIILRPDGNAYLGNPTPGQQISTEGHVDYLIGDNTVNGSTGNTIKDRINTAEQHAKTYADGLASNYDPVGSALTAQSNAETFATNAANTAQSNAEAYTDTRVTSLVNSAPAVLDTLGELATALQNNPDIITNLQTVASGKQDTLTAGNGITIDNNTDTISTVLGTGLDFGVAGDININRATTDTWYDAAGTASMAVGNALWPNGPMGNPAYDSYGSASSAQTAAETYADTAANNAYTNATITAQGYANTAQNNAISYTDQAIVDGNSNAEPVYKGVKLGWYTELVSGWQSTNNGSTFIPLSWNSNYGTAKLTVHVRSGAHTQASEILVARDSSNNLHITEYALVTTNGQLADISVMISGNNVSLTVTPTAGHDQTEAVATGSVISWAD